MKQTIPLISTFFLAVFFLSSIQIINATILTVSNNPANPGEFVNINPAVDSASTGDTILIASSSTPYEGGLSAVTGNSASGIFLDKSLTIIGSGYAGEERTMVQGLFFYPNPTGYSGTRISGLNFVGTSRILFVGSAGGTTMGSIDSVTFRDCFFGSATGSRLVFPSSIDTVSSIHFINCIIYTADLFRFNSDVYLEKFEFNNCIISGLIGNQNPSGNYSPTITEFLLKNNLFISFGAQINTNTFSGSNHLIENNIFQNYSPGLGASNSAYNYNITFNTGNDTIPVGTNVGTNNLASQDPLLSNPLDFVQTITTSPIWISLVDTSLANFTLSTGSPATNAGSDGTDIGPSGGEFPWSLGNPPVPAPPVVEVIIITPSTIGINGTLNFEFTAKKQ